MLVKVIYGVVNTDMTSFGHFGRVVIKRWPLGQARIRAGLMAVGCEPAASGRAGGHIAPPAMASSAHEDLTALAQRLGAQDGDEHVAREFAAS
jgi:hypothetical protein